MSAPTDVPLSVQRAHHDWFSVYMDWTVEHLIHQTLESLYMFVEDDEVWDTPPTANPKGEVIVMAPTVHGKRYAEASDAMYTAERVLAAALREWPEFIAYMGSLPGYEGDTEFTDIELLCEFDPYQEQRARLWHGDMDELRKDAAGGDKIAKAILGG